MYLNLNREELVVAISFGLLPITAKFEMSACGIMAEVLSVIASKEQEITRLSTSIYRDTVATQISQGIEEIAEPDDLIRQSKAEKQERVAMLREHISTLCDTIPWYHRIKIGLARIRLRYQKALS
ncbi:MAG: hypothetical protein WCO23_05180 [bacterium]